MQILGHLTAVFQILYNAIFFPIDVWLTVCNKSPRMCLSATVLCWISLQIYFANIEFGSLFFIFTLFVLILGTLGNRKINEISAYSVFNPHCERLLGTLTAEQFEGELMSRVQK